MPPRRDIDADELRRQIDHGLSYRAIGRHLGVSAETVRGNALRLGLRSRHVGTNDRRPLLHDPEWMSAQFEAGRCIADVASELCVHYFTVVTARRQLGLAPRRAPKRSVDLDEVMRRLEAGETMGEIGRALGHSSSAISKAVRRASGW